MKNSHKGLTVNGYTWRAHDQGIHTFSRKEGNGYAFIYCATEQLTNGDIEFMTEKGLTIVKERRKAAIEKYWADQEANAITDVQFRIFKGEVMAIFPYLIDGAMSVMSYAHVGQHSGCYVFIKTKKATPEQYEPLKKELEDLGYKLRVIQRRNHNKYLRAYEEFINNRRNQI